MSSDEEDPAEALINNIEKFVCQELKKIHKRVKSLETRFQENDAKIRKIEEMETELENLKGQHSLEKYNVETVFKVGLMQAMLSTGTLTPEQAVETVNRNGLSAILMVPESAKDSGNETENQTAAQTDIDGTCANDKSDVPESDEEEIFTANLCVPQPGSSDKPATGTQQSPQKEIRSSTLSAAIPSTSGRLCLKQPLTSTPNRPLTGQSRLSFEAVGEDEPPSKLRMTKHNHSRRP